MTEDEIKANEFATTYAGPKPVLPERPVFNDQIEELLKSGDIEKKETCWSSVTAKGKKALNEISRQINDYRYHIGVVHPALMVEYLDRKMMGFRRYEEEESGCLK